MDFALRAIFLLLAVGTSHCGVIFNCQFSQQEIPGAGNNYICTVVSVQIVGSVDVVEDIRGSHLPGFGNGNVQAFYAIRQYFPELRTLSQIPRGIERFFPNLGVLLWLSGGLTTINADALQFPNLWGLDFTENDLVLLPNNLFSFTPNLRVISFNDNLIRNTGATLLGNLNQLTEADFRHNFCINFWAQTPAEVTQLRSLLPAQCPA